MPAFAVLLVLAAAVAHALWNVIAHGVSRIGLPFLWWGAVSSTVLWVGLVPATGGLGAELGPFALGVGVSAVLHFAYMLVLQRGYRVGNLSTVYATARGSGPLISVIVAVTVLGERPHPVALVGVAVVIAGVVGIGLIDRRPAVTASEGGLEDAVGGPGAAPRTRPRIDPGILFGVLTGVAIAAYTLWDAQAVRVSGLAPVAFMVGCTAVQIVLYSAALGRRHRELLPVLRAHWPRVVAFGVLSPLSYILVLTAVTIAPIALVAPMREVSVVMVSVFGALALREGSPRRRIAAGAVVVAGIVLMAF